MPHSVSSSADAGRAASLIRHRVPGYGGCGRPQAPDVIVPRAATRQFSFLESIVEKCPQAGLKKDDSDVFKTSVTFPGKPTRVICAISDYGVLTPGPVHFNKARFASRNSAVIVGVATGNIAGVTVAIVDHPGQQPPEDPFTLHVSTDTFDAGLHLQKNSATLITLRPNAAEVWFFGQPPAWAASMRPHEAYYDKLRKLTWSFSKKERALFVLFSAALLATFLGVRVKVTSRF